MVSEKTMTDAIYGTIEAWFPGVAIRLADDSTIIMTAPGTGQEFEITVKEKAKYPEHICDADCNPGNCEIEHTKEFGETFDADTL